MRLKKALFYSLPLLALSTFAAAATPPSGNFGWDNPVTQNAVEGESFLNILFVIITIIVIFVFALMLYICVRFREGANPTPSKTTHNTLIEVIWTVVPILILLGLVSPSFKGLWAQDVLPETELTVKVTGHTWHWEYEYVGMDDMNSIESFVLPKEEALAQGRTHLLATTKPLVVPSGTKVKLLVTSARNLHAFSMDPFWVKVDAIPDRLNQTWFEVFEGKEATYYGQCAELCGIDHYNMPIEVRVVTKDQFNDFVASGGKMASLPAETNHRAVETAALQE